MDKNENFWNRMADRYDLEELKDRALFERNMACILAKLKETDTVLDFGCGTGLYTLAIAEKAEEVIGLDTSTEMIRLAERKLVNHIKLRYICSELSKANFHSAQFDTIVATYILHLVPNPSLVLSQLFDYLKPGAKLLSITPCMASKPLMYALLSLLRRVGMAPAIRPFKEGDLRQCFLEAGFVVEEFKLQEGTSNQYCVVAQKPI
ncbi:MAG: class I SAM-dependent methyltransferase [Bacteroidetes bacterium]|nr:MAG: class I SAM-dependent methyltransferase [Bacteroidota bacterium]